MASCYEEQRQKNIERNQKLLASLGLLQVREELSVASKPQVKQVKKRKAVSKEEIGEPSKARRQSSRLQGVKGPDYSASKIICLGEFATTSRKKGVSGKGSSLAYQPHADEYYTVSNIDALKGCTTNYDNHPDRLRLEDRPGRVGRYRKDTGSEQAKAVGKTCHWCRQKDTSLKTNCSSCGSTRGRICGPCLQGRYGENIFEVVRDLSWTCPACRDICNCSAATCLRQQRGWGATGALVGRAARQGYPSVAHYLVLGKGFDAVAVALEAAIQSRDAEELAYLLAKAGRMELDKLPVDRRFPMAAGEAGALEQELARGRGGGGGEGAGEEEGALLFAYGASTRAVVRRLRALVAEAAAVAAELGLAVGAPAAGGPGAADGAASSLPPSSADGALLAAPAWSGDEGSEEGGKENTPPPKPARRSLRARKSAPSLSPTLKLMPSSDDAGRGKVGRAVAKMTPSKQDQSKSMCVQIGISRIRKGFGEGECVGVVQRKVNGFKTNKGQDLFLVKYTDGESEELTTTEILSLAF